MAGEEWTLYDAPGTMYKSMEGTKGVMICNNEKKCITSQRLENIKRKAIRLTDYDGVKSYSDNAWKLTKTGNNEYTICEHKPDMSKPICLENEAINNKISDPKNKSPESNDNNVVARSEGSDNPGKIRWEINNLPDRWVR